MTTGKLIPYTHHPWHNKPHPDEWGSGKIRADQPSVECVDCHTIFPGFVTPEGRGGASYNGEIVKLCPWCKP